MTSNEDTSGASDSSVEQARRADSPYVFKFSRPPRYTQNRGETPIAEKAGTARPRKHAPGKVPRLTTIEAFVQSDESATHSDDDWFSIIDTSSSANSGQSLETGTRSKQASVVVSPSTSDQDLETPVMCVAGTLATSTPINGQPAVRLAELPSISAVHQSTSVGSQKRLSAPGVGAAAYRKTSTPHGTGPALEQPPGLSTIKGKGKAVVTRAEQKGISEGKLVEDGQDQGTHTAVQNEKQAGSDIVDSLDEDDEPSEPEDKDPKQVEPDGRRHGDVVGANTCFRRSADQQDEWARAEWSDKQRQRVEILRKARTFTRKPRISAAAIDHLRGMLTDTLKKAIPAQAQRRRSSARTGNVPRLNTARQENTLRKATQQSRGAASTTKDLDPKGPMSEYDFQDEPLDSPQVSTKPSKRKGATSTAGENGTVGDAISEAPGSPMFLRDRLPAARSTLTVSSGNAQRPTNTDASVVTSTATDSTESTKTAEERDSSAVKSTEPIREGTKAPEKKERCLKVLGLKKSKLSVTSKAVSTSRCPSLRCSRPLRDALEQRDSQAQASRESSMRARLRRGCFAVNDGSTQDAAAAEQDQQQEGASTEFAPSENQAVPAKEAPCKQRNPRTVEMDILCVTWWAEIQKLDQVGKLAERQR